MAFLGNDVMAPITYFAYGSNMLAERLKARVPSARVLGRAELPGYSLRFNKLSSDGSAKANIVASGNPGDAVHGVLYELDASDRSQLDQAEGLGRGYNVLEVTVRTATGEQRAFAYVAAPEAIRDDLKPYDWYKDLIVAGATQNRLPRAYVRRIQSVGVALP